VCGGKRTRTPRTARASAAAAPKRPSRPRRPTWRARASTDTPSKTGITKLPAGSGGVTESTTVMGASGMVDARSLRIGSSTKSTSAPYRRGQRSTTCAFRRTDQLRQSRVSGAGHGRQKRATRQDGEADGRRREGDAAPLRCRRTCVGRVRTDVRTPGAIGEYEPFVDPKARHTPSRFRKCAEPLPCGPRLPITRTLADLAPLRERGIPKVFVTHRVTYQMSRATIQP